ncbi:hypothetical protein D6C77_10332 [Aureobasidium pullulans]|nr:hypothetical protein D6C77_10332 [Aureobasidium pullulans]
MCYVANLGGKRDLILGVPWMERHNASLDWQQRTISLHLDHCRHHCLKTGGGLPMLVPCANTNKPILPKEPFSIQEATAEEFAQLAHAGHETYALLHIAIDEQAEQEAALREAANDLCGADIEKFMDVKTFSDPATLLPAHYKQFADVFSRSSADSLPKHRPQDHEIRLQEGKQPPYFRPRGMSQDELAATKKYLDEHLDKGFIRPSASLAAAPVLLVRKPGGGMRFCVDYRGLNDITIKNRYPIPLIRETLDRLAKAKYFSKFDIIAAFNNIRVKEGDEWKTAFNTRYGQYEYLVMPFGLCNALGTFQSFINSTLHEYLDDFCTGYLDDILVFSETLEEHREHVKKVLQRLREARLYADIDKSEFEVTTTKYLGLIVSTNGLKMDPQKIDAVLQWPVPRILKDVQGFLGFSNFYRRFIERFSHLAKPLTDLTKSNGRFAMTPKATSAFEDLKLRFTKAPILAHFDFDKEVIVETDASNWVTAAVLSQWHEDPEHGRLLRPVAFMSKKMTPAECRYPIHDKEMLAIIHAFEEWEPELQSSTPETPVQVLTDHKALEYFTTKQRLSRRQIRWSEFMSEFNWKITYRPGAQQGKPDALSRRSADFPQSPDDEREMDRYQALIRPENLPSMQLPADSTSLSAVLLASLTSNEELLLEPSLHDKICVNQPFDTLAKAITDALAQGAQKLTPFLPADLKHVTISLADCTLQEGLVYVKNALYVPPGFRTHVIDDHHATPLASHPGRTGTHHLVSRNYIWLGMTEEIRRYVKNCHTCSRTKVPRFTHGREKALAVAAGPGRSWSIDFVVALLESADHNGTSFTNIMTATDRFTKRKHFVLMRTITTIDTAYAMLHIIKLYGVLEEMSMSSAWHPQLNGQDENTNQQMEQYLRAFVNLAQDD